MALATGPNGEETHLWQNLGDGLGNAIGDRRLKPCYLIRDDHNRKIRTRKQRTDVSKYSFVSGTVKSWNQLPTGLLVYILCKINMFTKGVKNVVTSKGVQVGVECK